MARGILVTTANTPNTGSYHLTMDSSLNGSYSLNEVILTINMTGRKFGRGQ